MICLKDSDATEKSRFNRGNVLCTFLLQLIMHDDKKAMMQKLVDFSRCEKICMRMKKRTAFYIGSNESGHS